MLSYNGYNNMTQILPGLFLGSLSDSRDREQIKENGITHIVTVIESPKIHFKELKYLLIDEPDAMSTNLHFYFNQCVEFIHQARVVEKGNVLVHCYAGVSRSVTIVVAYIMTCTDLSYESALNAVKGARKIASPNFGFQRQLQTYYFLDVNSARYRLKKRYGTPKAAEDETICKENIEKFWKQFDRYAINWRI